MHLVYEIREGGTWIACGVQVKGEVRLTDGLAWVLLPAAETAQALHIGNYGGLPEAHQKLDAWIVEEGRQAKGLSWEVYGDWVDNETQLQTWVYKALAE